MMIKKFVFSIFSTLLIICMVAVPVYAKAIPIRVPADAGWVDTGIDVEYEEIYFLKANGRAITGRPYEYPGSISGPEGQEYICSNENGEGYICVLNDAPFGALIGKIGEEGSSFYIGDALSIEAGESGRLYLAVNDYYGTYDDNQAGFTVIFK